MNNSSELLNNDDIKISPVKIISIKFKWRELPKILTVDTITFNCFTVGQIT